MTTLTTTAVLSRDELRLLAEADETALWKRYSGNWLAEAAGFSEGDGQPLLDSLVATGYLERRLALDCACGHETTFPKRKRRMPCKICGDMLDAADAYALYGLLQVPERALYLALRLQPQPRERLSALAAAGRN